MYTQQTTWQYRLDRVNWSSQQMGQAVEIKCIHSEFKGRKLTVCCWRSKGITRGRFQKRNGESGHQYDLWGLTFAILNESPVGIQSLQKTSLIAQLEF